jgi:hypothetical protein
LHSCDEHFDCPRRIQVVEQRVRCRSSSLAKAAEPARLDPPEVAAAVPFAPCPLDRRYDRRLIAAAMDPE